MSAQIERFSPMGRPTSQPSQRLLAAAAAERDGLGRRRDELLDQRKRLSRQIGDVDAESRPNSIIATTSSAASVATRQPAPAKVDAGRPADNARALRGPAIRRTAVQLLLADPRRPEALHYREWFGLLETAGYAVAGKDPLALFLSQISRCPVVRRGTQSGVYELDLAAVARLRPHLDDRQQQLRNLTAHAASSANRSEVRSRRTALTLEIDKLEKALEEAEALLGSEPDRLAATG